MSEEPRRIARRALFGRLLPQAPEAGHWVKVHRTAMACRFEVTLDSGDARHVDAARAALDEVDAIEASLSVFREASEVSCLNREAGDRRPCPSAPASSPCSRSAASCTPPPAGPSTPPARRSRGAGGFSTGARVCPGRRRSPPPAPARGWTRSRSTTWAGRSASRRPGSSSTWEPWGRAGRSTGSPLPCGCAASRGPS